MSGTTFTEFCVFLENYQIWGGYEKLQLCSQPGRSGVAWNNGNLWLVSEVQGSVIKAYRVWCSLQVLSIWVEVQEPQGCQRFGVGTWMLYMSVSKTHGPRHHLLNLGLDSRLRIYTPCPLSMGMWFVHSLIFCCSCYYSCFFVCPSFG